VTHNPLVVIEGDGYYVWCKTCKWESSYTPYLPLAVRWQELHKEGP
jgi:hypothetical protein